MTDEEMMKDFENFLQEKNIYFKPNPNHYPIIDKWNSKYGFMPNRKLIFDKIEELIDERINDIFEETLFNKMVTLEDVLLR